MTLIKTCSLKDFSEAIEVPIPDSTANAKMHRLHTWESGTSVMIVNFPVGWSRTIEGSYECAEEFLMIEGELQMSGDKFFSGDHAWVPPHSPRIAAFSPEGAVALAWFYGAPQWSRMNGAKRAVSQVKTHIDANSFGEIRPANANGLIGQTIKLPPSVYITPSDCEVIDLTNFTWSMYEAGSEVMLTPLSLIRI